MNILVSGLLWSGSSAVLDMLAEYKNVTTLPGEFDEFRRPGMIADHLNERISDIYPCQINNYISYKSKLNLTNPNCLDSNLKAIKRLHAINKFSIDIKKVKSKKEKMKLGQNWFKEIREIYADNKELIAIDQPILLGQHFDVWPKILSPFKLIVVYREPKDQISQIIKQNHLFLHMRSPDADIYGGDRIGAIKYQVETLKARLKWLDKIQEHHGESKVVSISFEMFIKHHEAIRKLLEDWCGLNRKDKIKEVLKPSESLKNIGIYTSYLTKEETDLLDELYTLYLEKEKSNAFYSNLI